MNSFLIIDTSISPDYVPRLKSQHALISIALFAYIFIGSLCSDLGDQNRLSSFPDLQFWQLELANAGIIIFICGLLLFLLFRRIERRYSGFAIGFTSDSLIINTDRKGTQIIPYNSVAATIKLKNGTYRLINSDGKIEITVPSLACDEKTTDAILRDKTKLIVPKIVGLSTMTFALPYFFFSLIFAILLCQTVATAISCSIVSIIGVIALFCVNYSSLKEIGSVVKKGNIMGGVLLSFVIIAALLYKLKEMQ